MLTNSQNATNFDKLRVRKMYTGKLPGVRIINVSQTFASGLISLLVEKILLVKLCMWNEKSISSPDRDFMKSRAKGKLTNSNEPFSQWYTECTNFRNSLSYSSPQFSFQIIIEPFSHQTLGKLSFLILSWPKILLSYSHVSATLFGSDGICSNWEGWGSVNTLI